MDLTVSFDAVELPGHGLERQLGLAARWELLGINPVGQQHDNEEGRKNRERHAPGPTLVRARHHIPLSSTPLLFQGGNTALSAELPPIAALQKRASPRANHHRVCFINPEVEFQRLPWPVGHCLVCGFVWLWVLLLVI